MLTGLCLNPPLTFLNLTFWVNCKLRNTQKKRSLFFKEGLHILLFYFCYVLFKTENGI